MRRILFINFLIITVLILSPETINREKFTAEGMASYRFVATPLQSISTVDETSTYTSRDMQFNVDGLTQYALVSTPKSPEPERGYPLIILLHGHVPQAQYSTINSYKIPFNYLANSEFIVGKPDLRGHGRSDLGENYDPTLDLLLFSEDVITLINALKLTYSIDTERIYLIGHSNGGDTALRIMVSKPDLLAKVVLWAPVTVGLHESDFYYAGRGRKTYGKEALTNPSATEEIEKYNDKLRSKLEVIGIKPEEIRFLTRLDNIETPIIIRHSPTDATTPISWSYSLVETFKREGNSEVIKLIEYPNDNHNLSNHWPEIFESDLKYFRSE